MMKKIIKAVIAEKVHPVLFDIFQSKNIECIDTHSLTEQEFLNALQDATILIVRSKKIDAHIIDAAPHLKIIGRAGSGLENIDVAYASQKGIICLNSPEGNRDAVAEHTIGMLLMLFNNLKKADTEVRNNIWDRKSNWGIEIKHQTVGIIGYGNMGSALAKKLSGFECSILVYDKYKQDIKDDFVQVVDLKKIFELADIVSIHLPLNKETLYLVDDKFFEKFQKSIYFVNTSRGKIVRTSSLVNALKSGKVKGACLDVIEYEDTNFEQMTTIQTDDFEYLKKSDKVVLTPHIAGWTYQSYEKICRIIAEKVVEKLK
ncbi:MAG: NAD(P)-binding domain-containing protein [Bacteroidia bacterium]|nr:NAD(P)-binding domain-containing protein [Bacteroidia bacterium]